MSNVTLFNVKYMLISYSSFAAVDVFAFLPDAHVEKPGVPRFRHDPSTSIISGPLDRVCPAGILTDHALVSRIKGSRLEASETSVLTEL